MEKIIKSSRLIFFALFLLFSIPTKASQCQCYEYMDLGDGCTVIYIKYSWWAMNNNCYNPCESGAATMETLLVNYCSEPPVYSYGYSYISLSDAVEFCYGVGCWY